jgi:predicted GTPase
LEKLERVKKVVDDGIVKIVLLGSFSDGKTSAIAGLLGKLEDSMKIDETESSDEIIVYRPLGLKKGFEIVDTPGLFGSKEKRIDGQSVRFSDITKNYISEAHIVVYLCDAVVPLKDSHVEIVKKVLRDLNKLDSTIFVINKMDETDVDMLDDDDYARVSGIKKNNLIGRLRTTINLTPDEEKKLKVVCAAMILIPKREQNA